jgi:Restriction endonuclease BglII
MQISGFHSHLGGYEFIRVHRPKLWDEICQIVEAVSAEECISTRRGAPHYLVSQLQSRMQRSFIQRQWEHHRAQSLIGTKFVKHRVAVNVEFGKAPLGAYGFLANHVGQYASDAIDVGIEILPVKELSENLSSEGGSYEDELCSLTREGRGVPAVPLVLIGVSYGSKSNPASRKMRK